MVELAPSGLPFAQAAGLLQIHLLELAPEALAPEKLSLLMAWKYLGLSALALPELDQTSSSGLVAGNYNGWS